MRRSNPAAENLGRSASAFASLRCNSESAHGAFMRVLTLVLLLGGLCSAQATEDCKPSSLNIPGAKYPCIYSDGRATFRVVAPDARKAELRIGKNYDMVKGDDGAWSVTTAP